MDSGGVEEGVIIGDNPDEDGIIIGDDPDEDSVIIDNDPDEGGVIIDNDPDEDGVIIGDDPDGDVESRPQPQVPPKVNALGIVLAQVPAPFQRLLRERACALDSTK